MELRKTHLAAAVGAALMVGGTAVQAQNLQVQLYGQVNRALMFADDGHQSKWFFVDGQPSSTRFGIQGTSQISPGLRAGARIESEIKSNPSNEVSFAAPSQGALTGDAVGFAERWLDVFFEGSWGRVNLGQGSGAADDASTIDLSGTALANGNCVCDWGGGIAWRTTAGGLVGTTIQGTNVERDFESRYDRVMYTSPTFGGFRAQVGVGQKDNTGEAQEASLWYSGKFMGELQAAIGWSSVNLNLGPTSQDRETIGGSVSWLHTSGLNLTVWATQAEGIDAADAGRKGKFTGVKVGYKFGQHAIAVDYGMDDDQAAAGDEAKTYGLGYTWNPIRWAEIYAGYRIFQLDRPGVDVEDITVGMVGTRIRF
jgi:predicted porin